MNWQTLLDRWVFDAAAFVIMACLLRVAWHLNRARKSIDRSVTALERMFDDVRRREAAVREREGELW